MKILTSSFKIFENVALEKKREVFLQIMSLPFYRAKNKKRTIFSVGELKDPRQQGKVKYPFNEIILVALCASICGADTFIEFVEFGEAKIDFL